VQFIQRFLTELIPFALEVFQRQAPPSHVLTSLILFQLVGTCLLSERILSTAEQRDVQAQLLVLGSFWFLVTLSVVLWVLGSVVLHGHGGN
jgi:hypothetical protein